MAAFKNILLPIDFTANTDLAVKRAMDLTDPEGAMITLLHISGWDGKFSDALKYVRLRELRLLFEITIPTVSVNIEIIRGRHIEREIIKRAREIGPDLLILAKKSGRKFLSWYKDISVLRIARNSNCPVLTIKPGSDLTKIKSIVLPFGAELPKKKLDILVPLTNKQNTTVFMVALKNRMNEYELADTTFSHTLIETYRLLKGDLNCHLVHKLIQGNNFGKSILRFAKSVDADVLIANLHEMKISKITGLDISDMLDRDSKMQLLTIDQENTVVG